MAAPTLSHLLHASNLPDTQHHHHHHHHHHRPRTDTGRQSFAELPLPQPVTLGHNPGPGSTLPASSTDPGTLSAAASLPSQLPLTAVPNIATGAPSPQHYSDITTPTSSPALQVGSISGPGDLTGSALRGTEAGDGDGDGSPSETTTSSSVPHPPSLPPQQSAINPGHTSNYTPSSAQKSHANNSSLYQCADCQRRYSRPEHLARHIQTHTLGKRFGCQVCSKLFARADLLKRHTLNHQSDNDNKKRRKTDPGAGRVSHACRPCATARVKCEEVKPCTRCRNRNLNCEYASSEAGSAAAMHLLHLSKAHSNAPSTPTSSVTTNTSHEQSHQQQSQQPSAQQYYQPIHDNHTPTAASATLSHLHTQAQAPVPAQAQPLSHNQGYQIHSPSHHRQTPSQHSSHLPLPTPAHDNSPMSVRHHTNPEESQLPTPDTVMEQSQDFNNPPQYVNSENVIDMARLPFSDFLRDVLYEQSLDPSRMVEAQGLAVLDFCDDTNLELNDIDLRLLDHWNLDNLTPSAAHMQTPRADDALDLSQMRQKVVKIWSASPWRWDPNKQDSGYQEQGNLAIPTGSQLSTGQHLDRVIAEKLELSGRDKILATVLSTVKTNATLQRVSSSFPSVDVFDTLIHVFLASHMCLVSEFIHFSSFKLNRQWPDWLAVAAAAGAILTPVQTLRRLGYAIQEAVRLTMPSRFETNNTAIQDLGAIQAFVLVQDVGLWSGNRRKMEIAECHLLIPITMMRYRGKFQRSKYPVSAVEPSDDGEVLEDKWRKWYELESWKRLVFHAYIRDAQTSMTTLINPSMSYSELSLPLPEARELWFAKTAQEWKTQYLQRSAGHHKRPPSLGDLMRDITLLSQNHNRLDVQFSISIFLHGFWSLILEYRQLNSVHRTQLFSNSLSGNPNLLLTSRHQELCKCLQNFQAMTADWKLGNSSNGVMSAQETLVMNLLLMNLHVSMDDLQLFSGKEGEEQARRIYPSLQRWAGAPEARHALWNAGQIIRQAKMFPPGHLKDFYAVAVHHAALALWTYGVVTKATSLQPLLPTHPHFDETVYLDCTDAAVAHRYITVGQGRAVIRGPGGDNNNPAEASVEDPRACMDVVQEVLRANFSGEPNSLPAIVENLCHLIKQLGNAAWAVGLG